MSHFAPLLAAGDAELFKLIVLVVFGILAALGKYLAKAQQGKQLLENPQQPEPPAAANVANEIDEFMRRAAQARSKDGVRPARNPQLRTPVEKPVQAQIVTDAPVGGQINKQVETFLDTQEFSQRSTQLGGEVAQADKNIDQHLHQVFDHKVSKLESVPGEAATAPAVAVPTELTEQSLLDIPATFATGLTDLLADPDSVRQAIVFNEILNRPVERWT